MSAPVTIAGKVRVLRTAARRGLPCQLIVPPEAAEYVADCLATGALDRDYIARVRAEAEAALNKAEDFVLSEARQARDRVTAELAEERAREMRRSRSEAVVFYVVVTVYLVFLTALVLP